MLVMVWRTIIVRVRPDALIVFKPCSSEDNLGGNSHNFASRFRAGWKEGLSMFSWADKGRWHTVETSDDSDRKKGDWFRIGFEPLFVDFTKSGTWFVVIFLVQVRGGVSAWAVDVVER